MLVLTRKLGQKVIFNSKKFDFTLDVIAMSEFGGEATFKIQADKATEEMIKAKNGPSRT